MTILFAHARVKFFNSFTINVVTIELPLCPRSAWFEERTTHLRVPYPINCADRTKVKGRIRSSFERVTGDRNAHPQHYFAIRVGVEGGMYKGMLHRRKGQDRGRRKSIGRAPPYPLHPLRPWHSFSREPYIFEGEGHLYPVTSILSSRSGRHPRFLYFSAVHAFSRPRGSVHRTARSFLSPKKGTRQRRRRSSEKSHGNSTFVPRKRKRLLVSTTSADFARLIVSVQITPD